MTHTVPIRRAGVGDARENWPIQARKMEDSDTHF